MKNLNPIIAVLLIGILTSTSAFAQQFNLGKTSTYLNQLKNISAQRKSDPGIDVRVSSSKTLRLIPNVSNTDDLSNFLLIGNVSGYQSASFRLQVNNGDVSGHVIIYDTKEAYQYADVNGNITIEKTSIDKVVCIDYAKNVPAEDRLRKADNPVAYKTATLDLQSLPGATGCILLDFDGQFVPKTGWNNGNDINAAPSGMSDAQVQEFWELVSEDYRPYNLNITTNEGVFNSYPQNRRRRCIITPTNTAAPGAGGVAYIGSFTWNNDEPCWEFMTGGAKAPGDAASHEIGHTLGLGHDGRELPSGHEEYYAPNNGWAPIMGAGYYTNTVQWSKGEYDYANNKEDDLAKIANDNGFGYRNDQHGNNTGSAANLNVNGDGNIIDYNNYGVIERTGDVDVFRFATSTGGNVTLNANTVWRHQNLDILIRIYNGNGNEIGNSNGGGYNESWSGNLGAGTYYIAVSGTGAGNAGNGGYSNYGSLGSYTISGFIPNPNTRPGPSTGLVTIYEDINFTGYSNGLSTGDYNLATLKGLGMGDNTLTSLKVSEGYKAILYFDDNFTGNSVTITADQGWIGGTFNDQVTSIQVRPNGNPNLAGTYYLKNSVSGLFVDLAYADAANGTKIQQWGYNGSEAQKFRLEHLGDGNYRAVCVATGKVLDVAGVSQDEGALIHEWDNANGKNQHFILLDAGNGLVKLIAEHSGKVVEVSTNNTGEQLHQWWNAGQANSFWRLMPANQTGVVAVYTDCNNDGFRVALQTGAYKLADLYPLGFTDNSLSSMQVPEGFKVILYADDNFTGNSITITDDVNCYSAAWNDQVTSLKVLPNGNPNLAGTYYIKNSASGLTVDLANADPANGAQIRQWTYNGSDAQKFKLVHLGDGNYTVEQVSSGKVLDVLGGSLDQGKEIIQWGNANVRNQHFILVDAGNGLFKMIAEHTAMVAEVSTNNVGEALHQWANAGQANSKWLFIPTDQVIGTGTGLRANYFNGQNFETPVYASLDATIDTDWGNGSPNAAVNNDGFTARWTGQVQAKTSTEYTFYINSDNGRRLWVNNQLIIDKWLDDVNENSGKITLVAGQKYDIKIEYFENNGGAEVHLSWSTAASGKEIIPAKQLYPNALPTASITTPTNNQSFTSPSAISIATNTADTDGSIARVEFYNGTIKLGEKTASPFTYSWTGAAKGSYTVTVRAYDNRGAVVTSSAINVTVKDPIVTDVNDVQIGSGFAIYPNPVENTLYVSTSEDLSTAQINIFDAQGKLVSTSALHAEAVYVGDLQAGFYIIEIVNQDNRHVQRFVKK